MHLPFHTSITDLFSIIAISSTRCLRAGHSSCLCWTCHRLCPARNQQQPGLCRVQRTSPASTTAEEDSVPTISAAPLTSWQTDLAAAPLNFHCAGTAAHWVSDEPQSHSEHQNYWVITYGEKIPRCFIKKEMTVFLLQWLVRLIRQYCFCSHFVQFQTSKWKGWQAGQCQFPFSKYSSL